MDGELAQNAAMIAVAIVAAFIGVFRYIKTEADKSEKATPTDTSVMAASFLDSRLIRELIDSMRAASEDYARETRKLNRSRQDMITALEESTDAVINNTDAVINMVRFIRRQDSSRGTDNDNIRDNV